MRICRTNTSSPPLSSETKPWPLAMIWIVPSAVCCAPRSRYWMRPLPTCSAMPASCISRSTSWKASKRPLFVMPSVLAISFGR